jgi:uncharacterized membrane-anchored protein
MLSDTHVRRFISEWVALSSNRDSQETMRRLLKVTMSVCVVAAAMIGQGSDAGVVAFPIGELWNFWLFRGCHEW